MAVTFLVNIVADSDMVNVVEGLLLAVHSSQELYFVTTHRVVMAVVEGVEAEKLLAAYCTKVAQIVLEYKFQLKVQTTEAEVLKGGQSLMEVVAFLVDQD